MNTGSGEHITMNALAKAVILDLDTFKADELDLDGLMSLPVEWTCYGNTLADEVPNRISEARIVLTNKVELNRDAMNAAPLLEYIGVLATGTNNIDHEAARDQGIRVTNVKGYGTPSVVQHCIMLMLNLATSFTGYQRQIERGEWQKSTTFCLLDNPIVELSGKHLVIVGYGELGRALEQVALAFGMKVSIASRPGVDNVDGRKALNSLLPEADFVSLHCLLSEQTKHLINAQSLALMKSSAFLINTARGPLIDESALVVALKTQGIAGAAVDVLDCEPPSNGNILLDSGLDNLIVTPHNAWASLESRQRLLGIAAQNLQDFLSAKT